MGCHNSVIAVGLEVVPNHLPNGCSTVQPLYDFATHHQRNAEKHCYCYGVGQATKKEPPRRAVPEINELGRKIQMSSVITMELFSSSKQLLLHFNRSSKH